MRNKREILIVFMWLLFGSFFGLISLRTVVIPDLIGLICMFMLLLTKRKVPQFGKFLMWYLAFILVSILSSKYYEGQSIYLSLTAADLYNFLPVLSYFFCLWFKLSTVEIKRTLSVFFILFVFAFSVQFFLYPRELFVLTTSYPDVRRFTMAGQMITYIGLFYFATIYFYNGFNMRTMLVIMFSIINLFNSGFRTQLAFFSLAIFLLAYSIKRMKVISYIPIALFLAFAMYQLPLVQRSIGNMISRQEANASFDNDDYIRWMEFRYFTTSNAESPVEYVLGSGIPNPRSHYGQPFFENEEYVGTIANWRDWGLVGLTWVIGIPAVIFLILPALLIVFKKSSKELLFIKFLFIALFLSSVTTVEFYRQGSFFLVGILYYYYERQNLEEKHRRSLI